MDIEKDIEKQNVVMGYPSKDQETIKPSHNNNVMPSPNNPPNKNVNYSQKNKQLQDEKTSWPKSRYMMIIMPIVVIVMGACGLIWWIMNSETKQPHFQLKSLQVPTGLQITNTSILGNWNVNMTIENPNVGHNMNFVDPCRIAIMYETNLLADDDMTVFRLKERGSASFFYNMTVSPEIVLDKGLLSELGQDKNRDGILKFTLQTNLKYYVSSDAEVKKENMRIICNDLNVKFGPGPNDKGELMKTDNIDCVQELL